MSEAVLFEIRNGVALIQLNRPDIRNALCTEIKVRLEQIVPAIVADRSVRCVLIAGTGKSFCAGADLTSMGDRSAAATMERMQRAHRWIRLLTQSNIPVVTAVNGVAIGAGFGLALLGDVVVAADDARFQAGFPRVGAVPDLGLAWTLPRAVGEIRAKDILMSNRAIHAPEALTIGLISRVVPAERLFEEALKIADALAEGPTVSLGLTKSLVRATYGRSLSEHLASEAAAQAVAFAADDFGEGVEAFRNRRPPQFRGT